jgi:fructose-specific phosphotransferase system IIA component
MILTEILKPSCVKVPLDATDKKSAIFELVDIMESANLVRDAESLKAAVWTREQTRTTGIGHGLAIPHGKCDSVTGLAMAIGRPSEPLEFAAIDQRPVRLIVLLASPPDRTSDHIQALAKISRLMTDADFREKLFHAESSEELYAMLAAQEQHVAS